MGFIFNDNNNDVIGVDVGTSAIKIVQLTRDVSNNFAFKNFAIARLKKGNLQSANQVIIGQQISQILSTALQKSNIKTNFVSFSIPSFSSFISFITLPQKYSEQELPSKLEIEARKYIPIPLSQVSLGWEVLQDRDQEKSIGMKSEKGAMKILLMAVANDTIQKYESIAANANLNLKSIEVESFALVRSLGRGYQGTSLILDIGSKICNILIASNDHLRGSRNVDIGGGDISEAIARSLNIDYNRSENLKKERGVNDSQLSGVISPVITRVSQETKRVIEAYNSKNPARKVSRVILSGGTAKLRGLDQYLRSELGVPIEAGDPWRGVKFSEKDKTILNSFKNELAVAIGLAMN